MIQPVNANAIKEVRDVLAYLESIRGKGILTGQHTQTMKQEELLRLQELTGKLPAVCGFELLAYSPNVRYETCDEAARTEIDENQGTLQRAYEWAEKGGLVTFTWHWYSPIGGRDKSFYAKNTDFDATQVLVEGTPEREAFYKDLDVMAEYLRGFCEKRIPILWRPFHEAEGTWFWWGAKGMDVARELFRMMYRYYTEVKHLDNLIWVWNNGEADGYVGDEFCDVVSVDKYPNKREYTDLEECYREMTAFSNGKLMAIGEIGTLPDMDGLEAKKLEWLWFMSWSKEFVLTDQYTADEVFYSQYNHPFAITLEKLPKLY